MVFITGAASGIGAATAAHFASLGYRKLSLLDRDAEKLAEVAEKCRSTGADVQELVVDLCGEEATRGSVGQVVGRFGRESRQGCQAGRKLKQSTSTK